ncbi:MAG: glycosyltransferase [Melioribacteraceae bacterium]|jgi:glycosyltransferase involved in cell wall biosynthesis|nr:glycosyltransferase [Melioribacteraceae bacterium]
MSVAAITITFNRLDLTKRTIKSFYEKTGVDYHLFIDNGSTDGTVEWLEDYNRVLLGENLGIATAFYYGVNLLKDYDYILKLDNDVETVTEDMIAKLVRFIEIAGPHAVSPPDLMIDPAFYPQIYSRKKIQEYDVQYTSHTGGAFQLVPTKYCLQMVNQFTALKGGDMTIGWYYKSIHCPPAYLLNLGMNHIGLNRSTPVKDYIF